MFSSFKIDLARFLLSKLLFLLFICTVPAENLKLAVAANFGSLIQEAKILYEQKKSVLLDITLASSGQLYSQILNGAPFDIFLAADEEYPQKLAGEIKTEEIPFLYATGQLVLVAKSIKPTPTLTCLLQPGIKISIAKPELAPYGKSAINLLSYFEMKEKVLPKLVYANNISQAAAFFLKAADFGFLAASQLRSKELKEYYTQDLFIEIDPEVSGEIHQAGLLIAKKENKASALQFIEWLLGEETIPLYQTYGYRHPSQFKGHP